MRTSWLVRSMLTVSVMAALASCGDDVFVPTFEQVADERLANVSVRPDLRVDVVVDGLVGPTQFVLDGESFVVAEINGGENDGTGRVVRVGPDGATEVLLDGLDKPTGIAIVDDELWVMERDRLTRGRIGEERVVVADGLPNNGRSQGTLTVLDDGRLLFDTSGSKRGSAVADGSGRLFTVDVDDPSAAPVEFASGFKHAYAHVVDEAGVLWSTEMTDGRFDGTPAADEVVAVIEGADHGWPFCVGDNRPVVEFGGGSDGCAGVPSSQVAFAPSATPTGLTTSPFTAETLWVALWNERRVVAIGGDPDERPAAIGDVLTGLQRPQHLVSTADAVYLTDFGAGTILRVRGAAG